MSGRGRYVEVCAGAGGWGLGLHAAGWKGTGIERDLDASETHRRHVGPCLTADVTTVETPHAADFACGGVPCQPFSAAGDRKGLDDPRGQLFRALLRHAAGAGARCVAMENVRGLVSCGALPVIFDAFRAAGFEPVHALLNACDYGVPQSRVRLFIVGFRDAGDLARFRWPRPTHGAPGNLFGLPPWRTVREALGLPVAEPAGARGTRRGASRLDRPAPTIGAGGVDGGGGAEPLANAVLRRELLGEIDTARLDRPAPTVKANSWHEGVSERASRRASSALAAALATARVLDRPATTADTRGALSAAGHHASNKDGAVRLTVRDCARLQSFPDAVEFVGNASSQHRQVGNAVPPPLGEAVARSVWEALYG